MSSTNIHDEVVRMSFDNKNFESNVKTSMSTIDKLKSNLDFSKSAKSFNAISEAAGDVKMGPLASAVESVKDKFSVLEVVGITALVNLSNSAVEAGKRLVSSLTIDNVASGWAKNEEKMKGMQTIISATGKSVDEVEASLEKLNWFTDETSYSFTDMVNNIGKFTSNNVELDTAVTAMQGIANWAAVSGQNAGEASRAMYNLSQAISVGSVKLIDWKSIQNANMATTEFKQTVLDTAVELGQLKKVSEGVYKTIGKGTEVTNTKFTEALTEGWFNTDVLLKSLDQYGRFADRLFEISEKYGTEATPFIGYLKEFKNSTIDIAKASEDLDIPAEELEGIFKELSGTSYELAFKAFQAAQQCKTFQDVVDYTKDAVGSVWMNLFGDILGNYDEQVKLWSDLGEKFYDWFVYPMEKLEKIVGEAFGEQGAAFEDYSNEWSALVKSCGSDASTLEGILKSVAKEHGVAIEDMIKDAGSFEATLQNGWLTEEIFSDALNDITESAGSVSMALEELEAIGLRVIRGEFGNGAERIKKLTDAGYEYATVQSYVNSIINKTKFDFDSLTEAQMKESKYTEEQIAFMKKLQEQAEKTGTPVSDLIKALQTKKPSGRELLLDSFANIADAVARVINPIKEAWGEIFKGLTSEGLYNFLEGFNNFTKNLLISEKTSENIRKTFHGIFSVFNVLLTVIKRLGSIFTDTVSYILSKLNIDITQFTAGIGDSLTELSKAILESEYFEKALRGIGDALIWLVDKGFEFYDMVKEWVSAFIDSQPVQDFFKGVTDFFSNMVSGDAANGMSVFSGFLNSLSSFKDGFSLTKVFDSFVALSQDIGKIVNDLWTMKGFDFDGFFGQVKDTATGTMKETGNVLSATFGTIKTIFSSIFNFLSENIDVSTIMAGGLIASFWAMYRGITKVITLIKSPFEGFNQLMLKTSGFVGELTTTLSFFNEKIGAKQTTKNTFERFAYGMIKIAEAIAIIAASVAILAMMDGNNVLIAGGVLAGILILITVIIGMMGHLEKIQAATIIKASTLMQRIGNFILEIAAAMLIIAIIPLNLDLVGKLALLAGIVVGLVIFVRAVQGMEDVGFEKAVGTITALIFGITMLSGALMLLSFMDTGKAIVSIFELGILVTMMVGITKLINAFTTGKTFTSLLAFSAGILIVVMALKVFSGIDFNTMMEAVYKLDVLFFALVPTFLAVRATGDAAKGTIAAFVGVGLCLVLMAATVAILKGIEPADILKGTIAIAAFSLIIKGLLEVMKLGKNQSYGNALLAGGTLIMASVAIAIIAVIASLLGKIELANLAKGTLAVSAIGGIVIGLLYATKYAEKIKMGVLVMLTVAIGLIGGLLITLANFDPVRTIVAATAMAEVFASFALILASVEHFKLRKNLIKNLALMEALLLGLAAIAVGVMLAMGLVDENGLLAKMTILTAFMYAMVGLLKVMSLVVPSVKALNAGIIAQIGIYIAEITGIIVLIAALIGVVGGLLDAIGAGDWLVNGIKTVFSIIAAIAEGIGNVAASFVKGFADTIIASLPIWADHLNAFAVKISTFATTLGTINGGRLIENVTAVVAAIMKIAEAQFVSGISSFFFGGSLDAITKGLPALGEALNEFASKIDDSLVEKMKIAALSAMALAEMVNLLPAKDGLMSSIFGSGPDLEAFATSLPQLGEGLAAFCNSFKDVVVNGENVESAANAAVSIAKIYDALPHEGGWVQQFLGAASVEDLEAFAGALIPLGEGIKNFAEEVTDVSYEGVDDAVDALVKLAELRPEDPHGGFSIVRFVKGQKQVLQDFANDFPFLGNGLRRFFNALNAGDTPLDTNIITVASSALKTLSQTNIRTSQGSLFGVLFGQTITFQQLSSSLEGIGVGLRAFYDALLGNGQIRFEPQYVASAANSISTISNTDINVEKATALNDFALLLPALGKNLYSFYASAIGINPESVNGVAELIRDLIDASNKADLDFDMRIGRFKDAIFVLVPTIEEFKKIGQDADAYNRASGIIDRFLTTMTTISRIDVTKFEKVVKGVDDYVRALEKMAYSMPDDGKLLGNNYIVAVKDGITEKFDDVIKAVEGVGAILRETSSVYEEEGKSAGDKFIKGLDSKKDSFNITWITLLKNAITGMRTDKKVKEALETSSASILRDFELNIRASEDNPTKQHAKKAGKYVGTQFVNGIKAETTMTGIAYDITRGFNNAIQWNLTTVRRAATDFGATFYLQLKDYFGIRSPSREMAKIGMFNVLGFVNGIEDYSYKAEDAAKDFAEDTMYQLRSAMNAVYDIVESDMDLSPKITPVLDLTNIQNGASAMSGLLSGNTGLSTALNLSNTASDSVNTLKTLEGNTSALEELTKTLKDFGGSSDQPINNNFYISGADPHEIAEEVSHIIQQQVGRARATWA